MLTGGDNKMRKTDIPGVFGPSALRERECVVGGLAAKEAGRIVGRRLEQVWRFSRLWGFASGKRRRKHGTQDSNLGSFSRGRMLRNTQQRPLHYVDYRR